MSGGNCDRVTEPLKRELAKLIDAGHGDLNRHALVDHFHSSVSRQFLPGKRVRLKVKRNGRFIEGVVMQKSAWTTLKIKDTAPSEQNKKKEKKVGTGRLGSMCEQQSAPTAYDIKVDNENMIISSILAGDIVQCCGLPSDEALLQLEAERHTQVVKDGAIGKDRIRTLWPLISSAEQERALSVLPLRTKLSQSGCNSTAILPKKYCSSLPSEMIPQLKLVRLDTPSKMQPTGTGGKKLKQMTLIETVFKMSSVKRGEEAAIASKQAVYQLGTYGLSALEPLPDPKPLVVPSGMPSSAIGDSLMVVEFVICYRAFLRPEKSLELSFGHLVEALLAGPNGFFYLNHLLILFLRVLIHDKSKNYKFLKIKLSALPISIYCASELTRLCLEACQDQQSTMVSDVVAKLKTEEFYRLSVVEKVCTLVTLCNEVMVTPSIATYKTTVAATFADLEKTKMTLLKENVDRATNVDILPDQPPSVKGFYGLAVADGLQDENDGILVVHNQRLQALKVQKANQLRFKMEEGIRLRAIHKENVMQKYRDTKKMLEMLTRVGPLGTDRNQSLYWLTTEAGCGLLVECWPHSKTSCGLDRDQSTEWFIYDTWDRVKLLMTALSDQLHNECALLQNLKSHEEDICAAMQRPATVSNTPLTVCNGDVEIEEAIYEEMIKMERDLFKASLEFASRRSNWLLQLEKAKKCSDYAACLLELYVHVPKNALSYTDYADTERWKEEVQECCVLSKLYLLMHAFLSCVKRDQLPRHAICGVCCRRNHRSPVVVCNGCDTVFHASCLYPPLVELPESGHFLCPGCQGTSEEALATEVKPKMGISLGTFWQTLTTPVCCRGANSSKGDMVSCCVCRAVYHKACHRPPLRNTPRGWWACSRCTNRK